PFLYLLLIGMVDLGLALNRYFLINRIAYEGVRFAASVPALEDGTYPTAAAVTGSPSKPGHMKVRDRVNALLATNGISLNSLPADYLTTELLTVTDLQNENGS